MQTGMGAVLLSDCVPSSDCVPGSTTTLLRRRSRAESTRSNLRHLECILHHLRRRNLCSDLSASVRGWHVTLLIPPPNGGTAASSAPGRHAGVPIAPPLRTAGSTMSLVSRWSWGPPPDAQAPDGAHDFGRAAAALGAAGGGGCCCCSPRVPPSPRPARVAPLAPRTPAHVAHQPGAPLLLESPASSSKSSFAELTHLGFSGVCHNGCPTFVQHCA